MWRPRLAGDPEHDLAPPVPGVEPLVGFADLYEVQHFLHERFHMSSLDEQAHFVQTLPLAHEQDAVERLVVDVERRQVSLGTMIVASWPKGLVAGMLLTMVLPPTVSKTASTPYPPVSLRAASATSCRV